MLLFSVVLSVSIQFFSAPCGLGTSASAWWMTATRSRWRSAEGWLRQLWCGCRTERNFPSLQPHQSKDPATSRIVWPAWRFLGLFFVVWVFFLFFSARSRRPICARDALRAANLSTTVLLARSPFCVRSAVQARKPIWTVLLARSPFCARSAMQAPKPIWAVLLARSPICARDALRARKPIYIDSSDSSASTQSILCP